MYHLFEEKILALRHTTCSNNKQSDILKVIRDKLMEKLKLLENRGDGQNSSMNLQIEIGNGVMLEDKRIINTQGGTQTTHPLLHCPYL